ncbi:MAG: DUF3616 domain-containing protein [Rhodoferax sp.]|uniref:DUF3616 domain-containing protein n=1 Tax=Rhodoferax sp. TaxID=50421 RepID=UPI001B5F6B35|nr:DUF3616 domain-containing protein [Rhodoferax sp.]MBP9904368.1 DUF3616 domain-containing protein [Rhodoferax sp.]
MKITLMQTLARFFVLISVGTSLALGQTVSGLSGKAAAMVGPEAGLWDAGQGFQFDLGKKKRLKARQSVSGIACQITSAAPGRCLLVFDEGAQARYATLAEGHLQPEGEAVAFPGRSGELDAEGAASDGRFVYITGSHSAKRADCASNPDSRWVVRAPLNADPMRVDVSAAVSSAKLWTLMLAHPELQPFVGENKCLGTERPAKAPQRQGQQGINIEGLAVRDGLLYFGLRGPVIGGQARVLSLPADALFVAAADQAAAPRLQVSLLALGAQRGIRDMVAVSDGVLLLAGPDDDDRSQEAGWAVFWWDGRPGHTGQPPRLLAGLDLSQVKLRACDVTIKPEAMTVWAETATAYRLLILSDGLCDGGALVFTVPR